jgi:outer membrane protein with beta-barrel domain
MAATLSSFTMRRPTVKRLLVSLSVTTLLAAGPASAGIGAHNGEIGFDFGYGDFDNDLAGKNGARVALRGGYHFTDWFQIEGESMGTGTTETVAGTEIDTTIAAFLVNGVFNFHPGHGSVVPYILGGLGFTTVRERLTPGGRIDDTGGASQLAAGSRFFFGSRKQVALRLGAGLMWHKASDLIVPGQTFVEKSLMAGFTWRIGADT